MDIKQIREDFDARKIISRCTWGELLAHAEQADAVLAGRQQKIGSLNMRIAELEARTVNVPRVASNPAAHDWAAITDLPPANYFCEFTIEQGKSYRIVPFESSASQAVAAPTASLPDLIDRLRASIAGKESFEEATAFVANISAAIQWLEQASRVAPVVQAAPDGCNLLDEIECDLPYLFGRASNEGHQSGQDIAMQVRAKMQQARAVKGAESSSSIRNMLLPMHDEDGLLNRWYFDCDTFYVDVEKDDNGKFSIYFRDRTDNTEGWHDQAAAQSAAQAVAEPDRDAK